MSMPEILNEKAKVKVRGQKKQTKQPLEANVEADTPQIPETPSEPVTTPLITESEPTLITTLPVVADTPPVTTKRSKPVPVVQDSSFEEEYDEEPAPPKKMKKEVKENKPLQSSSPWVWFVGAAAIAFLGASTPAKCNQFVRRHY